MTEEIPQEINTTKPEFKFVKKSTQDIIND